MKKEDLLNKLRQGTTVQFDMPEEPVKGIVYKNVAEQFIEISKTVGGKVIEAKPDDDLNAIIQLAFPDAKVLASNVEGITADKNPDTVADASELNGVDVGIVRGDFGVAENGCIWVPQTMKERAICFISEELVILVDRSKLVNNMHEAYKMVEMNHYGYGVFISGPSKTADIEQALVMGAQAAHGLTVILIDK